MSAQRVHKDFVDASVPFAPELPSIVSWQAIDLVLASSVPPEPPTIGGMLYPAKRTSLSGETEAMKTWAALVLAKAEMDAGFHVGWADLDAMGVAAILERLRARGVADEVISERFHFFEPDKRLVGLELDHVTDLISTYLIRMFVIDSFNPILTLHGLDPNSTPDIETFWQEVADPICKAGAAPVLLDHVPKNAEGRGKYAYGSRAQGERLDRAHRLQDAECA